MPSASKLSKKEEVGDGRREGGGGVGLRLLGFVQCVQLREDRSDAPSGVGEDRSGQRKDAIAGLDE